MSECSFTVLAELEKDLSWAEQQEEEARREYKAAQAMARTLRWQIYSLMKKYREMNVFPE